MKNKELEIEADTTTLLRLLARLRTDVLKIGFAKPEMGKIIAAIHRTDETVLRIWPSTKVDP